MQRNKKQVVTAAVAGVLALGLGLTMSNASADHHEKKKDMKCQGANSCKGMGACSSAGHGCAGKNDCKGKGWIHVGSEKECKDKGGTVVQ